MPSPAEDNSPHEGNVLSAENADFPEPEKQTQAPSTPPKVARLPIALPDNLRPAASFPLNDRDSWETVSRKPRKRLHKRKLKRDRDTVTATTSHTTPDRNPKKTKNTSPRSPTDAAKTAITQAARRTSLSEKCSETLRRSGAKTPAAISSNRFAFSPNGSIKLTSLAKTTPPGSNSRSKTQRSKRLPLGTATPTKASEQKMPANPTVEKLSANHVAPSDTHVDWCQNCTPSSSCSTGTCPCHKKYRKCTSNCQCSSSACRNRSTPTTSSHADSNKENDRPPSTPLPSEKAQTPGKAQASIRSYLRPTKTRSQQRNKNSQPHDSPAVSTPMTRTNSNAQSTESQRPAGGSSARSTARPARRSVFTPSENGDLPHAIITPSNQKPDDVYGDHIHDDPGFHLSGGIADDKTWQACCKQLLPLPPSHCNVPRGKIGTEIINALALLLQDIMARKCNAEKFLVFIMVILQRCPTAKTSADVRRRLSWRLGKWKEGSCKGLVEDTTRIMKASLSKSQGSTTPEQRAKTFDSKVKRGNLRSAVRCITDRETGGILHPDDIDDKTGKRVIDVLKSKHPPMREPGPVAMKDCDDLPDLVDLDVGSDTVERIAAKLSGSAGLSGMDSTSLKHLLLQHGGASNNLRVAVAAFVRWLSNTDAPWAACRAFQWSRLIALPKNPGVRPIGCGDVWRRLFAKCSLFHSAEEARAVCGADQLCAGLSTGIEGAIHGMTQLWNEADQLDAHGFLLVDARNAFNETNRISMLWNIRHLWPRGARFAFNCYKHHSGLVCRAPDGDHHTLCAREGTTQGDPLSMFCYGTGVLPLARHLKEIHLDCANPWCADDTGIYGRFDEIKLAFDDLVDIGPQFGCFPEPSKSTLIVKPKDKIDAESYFNAERHCRFQVVTGSRCLGGCTGTETDRDEWLSSKTFDWEMAIPELTSVAATYPQTACAGLQKSLQHEWGFLQRVLPGTGHLLTPLEDTLANNFIPAIFGEASFADDDCRRPFTALPVKHAGLSIPDPTASASDSYELSTLVGLHLIQAVKGSTSFSFKEHSSIRAAAVPEWQLRKDTEHAETLKRLLAALPDPECNGFLARTIGRGGQTGAWLTVMPSTINGTELGGEEFRDALRLRCGRTLAHLPSKCDGCGAKFSLEHALQCEVGGLIHQRHDEVNQELAHLASPALKHSAVRAEPLITPGPLRTCANAAESPTDSSDTSPDDIDTPPVDKRDRGDLLVRGLWETGRDCILDVRVTDLDAPSHRTRRCDAVLASQEQQKKRKCVDNCLEQRRTLNPFVISADGMLGYEATHALKQIAKKLSEKWQQPHSSVCGMVRARISLACVRSTHLCLRGSRIPFDKVGKRLLWKDGAGFSLFEADNLDNPLQKSSLCHFLNRQRHCHTWCNGAIDAR